MLGLLVNNYNLRKRKPSSETCATQKRKCTRGGKTNRPDFEPSSIPSEIWCVIFSFLSSADMCAVVSTCKAWKSISFANPPKAWKALSIQSDNWDLNNLRLPRYSKLESLEITHSFSPAIGIEIITRCCQNLMTLKLTSAEITTDGCRQIGLRCPKLRALCIDSAAKVTDNGVKYIAMGCPLLKRFRLRGARKVTDKAFEFLGANCPKLEVLNIEGCNISNNALAHLNKGCPKIHSLTVQFSGLTEQGLMEFCTREMSMVLVGCQDANMKKMQEGEWFFAGKRWVSQQPDWGVDVYN